jgi:glycosyltransferase involved in cell wall biosynthesis
VAIELTNRIRVAQIVLSLIAGGMEHVVKVLSLGLDPSTFKVSVFCILEKGLLAEKLEERNIDVFVTKPKYGIISNFYPRYLSNIFKEHKPHIVHSHSGCWFPASIAARMARIPIMVHTEHGRFSPDKKLIIQLDRIAMKRTDYLACVAEDLAKYMIDVVRVPKDRLGVITNGIELDDHKPRWDTIEYPIRRQYGIPENAKVIVTAGRLEPVKGHKYLIEAIQKLKEQFGNLFLWILGDGSLRAEIEMLVKHLGLNNVIFMPGNVHNVPDYLRESDIFVLPSLSEGTPMALLEAMATGLPIVATYVGGIPKILENGRAGILVNPGSSEAVGIAIKKVMEDNGLGLRLAKEAYNLGLEKYSSHTMVSNYENLYLNLLRNKGIA